MKLSIDKIPTIENNIANNYNIGQINKKKSEFNTDLIDNHTNTLKSIKNDIDTIKSNTYAPITSPKYFLSEIYLLNLDFIKELDFKCDTKSLLAYETIMQDSFKKDSFLELNESILYKSNDTKPVYFILKESYEFLNGNDEVLNKFSFNISSKRFIFYNIHIFKYGY